MREGITVEVSAADRARLEAVLADRSTRQKHAWRAQVILTTADGLGTAEIMRRTGKSKPCVWRWQERFMREGVPGLLRDKSRKPGKAPLPAATIDHVVELTLQEPPGEAAYWTGRIMAKVAGISLRSVQRIWKAHRLTPHRVRAFKLSKDPAFVPKLRDVVGLYMHPPAHAIVLSVDEKSQIQALDRTQPGLPMKAGPPATMTHDYERRGTTTLFAALNVLNGTVLPMPASACRARRTMTRRRRCAWPSRHLALDPNDARVHSVLGYICLTWRDFDCARRHLDLARAMNPNDAQIQITWALAQACLGEPERGLPAAELSMRLNPRYPRYYERFHSRILFLARRHAEAAAVLERITREHPLDHPRDLAWWAAACGHLERVDEARRCAGLFLEAVRGA